MMSRVLLSALALCMACASPGDDSDAACSDADADGLCRVDDNCPDAANPEQEDFNADGLGDACDSIHLALADLSTTASYLEYQSLEGPVFYFAVLDGSGQPHVAIDACENCYEARRGYRQEGTAMVCNLCGLAFEIDALGEQEGGCNPGIVHFETTDTHVIIEPEELEAASWYFEVGQ